ncbi:MAG: permease [Candidatus Andersenbacteria bacterium CG10_big_fil_rev_8_21_14_0_10_54_11]|uniref:Permease n=1 Tax=Candidatus Andersenbacteria bacterium CG10_big_fil_rev_8_21_14_0_10_54_11 TaxID=1974485 RepID=A0A2M6WY58_9BACT|nr:MAG: permease [Candidatus Andersenbacteria bacterium CG10_big_fil_rev_8_21_14_0_10_54_11]
MPYGLLIALAGAAVAAVLAGVGSILGVRTAAQASAGVVAEDPDKFGKVLLLTALPGSQGIYGFLAAIIIANTLGLLGGTLADVSVAQGWQVLASALPVGITCIFSAIQQGRVAAAAVDIVAKKPDASGKGVILAAIVETYAVLGLLVTILLVNGLGLGA